MTRAKPILTDPSEVTVMVKAASQPTATADALLYTLGVTDAGEWLRLYPFTFQTDALGQRRFKRWDKIRFTPRAASDDKRLESVRIVPESVQNLGDMPYSKRREFISALETTNLQAAMEEGKTVVLLRPRKMMLHVREKTGDDFATDRQTLEAVEKLQGPSAAPPKFYPFKFTYHFWTDEGNYESDYRDWDMHATFDNLSKSYGEAQAVARVIQLWGKEYLRKGVLFIMSRSSEALPYWNINGIISVEEIEDMSGASYSYNVLA